MYGEKLLKVENGEFQSAAQKYSAEQYGEERYAKEGIRMVH